MDMRFVGKAIVIGGKKDGIKRGDGARKLG